MYKFTRIYTYTYINVFIYTWCTWAVVIAITNNIFESHHDRCAASLLCKLATSNALAPVPQPSPSPLEPLLACLNDVNLCVLVYLWIHIYFRMVICIRTNARLICICLHVCLCLFVRACGHYVYNDMFVRMCAQHHVLCTLSCPFCCNMCGVAICRYIYM